ncbi:MAG: hypothetical protein JNM31_15550 [Flavobacteriales bacterium]|nr:hypothetical protein [Flavobacteriales bacterium]
MNWSRSGLTGLLLILLFPAPGRSQAPARTTGLKGRMFIYWGYNRARFSNSTIHFTGDGLDLWLHDVSASDRPIPYSSATYLDLRQVWLPQYNYRAGWYFHDRWSLSLGLDHMKYVMNDGQTVMAEGTVMESRSANHAMHDEQRELTLTDDVLTYEHTDGLNLLSVDLDHFWPLVGQASDRFSLLAFAGAGAGPVIPRSDVRLFGEGLNNVFHVAGYGLSAKMGVHMGLFRHFFLRSDLRGGYIDMPDVLTTGQGNDRASQHFTFTQWAWYFGGTIPLGKR